MPTLITPELRSFIEEPQGMSMGTRNANLKPEYCRLLGTYVVENDIIRMFIAKSTAERTIANIEENKLFSINLASPLTYESYQFKGICLKFGDCDDEDYANIDNYMTGFNDCLIKVGVKDGIVYKWPTRPSIAIEMKVEEIFDQTPKVGAGNKISTTS